MCGWKFYQQAVFNNLGLASTFIFELFYSRKLDMRSFSSTHSRWEPTMRYFSALGNLIYATTRETTKMSGGTETG